MTTCLLVAAGLWLVGAVEGPPSNIDEIITGSAAQPAFWGVYVHDLDRDVPFYSYNATNAFLPASNQKLLTAATALDAFGSDFRYRTVLYFDGDIEDGVLSGDLVLRGSGDPTFGSNLVGGGDPLEQWARRLAEMGVTRIEGRIVGDDDTFDDRPYAEGWDVDYVTSQASRALGVSIGGLAYRDNVVDVKITASGAGRPPEITTFPEGFLQIRNLLLTAQRRRGIAVTTQRNFGSEIIALRGSIPYTYDGTIEVPVTNPTAFAVNTFSRYLQDAGIDVAAETADVDDLDDFEYDTDTPLFVSVSPTLAEILPFLNKESNNFYAEQLFRSFAWGGSAEGGENRTKQLLSRAGVATSTVEIRDGSGLSRKNMITPEAMGRLLAFMYRHDERDTYLQSLPQGGERGSTLRYRLHDVPIRAKTGSLEFVRTLSGYLTTTDGRHLAFCVFANNYSGPSYQITQTIDHIVVDLAAGSS